MIRWRTPNRQTCLCSNYIIWNLITQNKEILYNMAITSKTRKELWAKSGNRCAICKQELVNQISEDDGSFIIGDECHIISSSTEGPRYKPGIEDYDSYDNLLLLCKNHHREIDENCTSYTEELLHYIKTSHENWVKETLNHITYFYKWQRNMILNKLKQALKQENNH